MERASFLLVAFGTPVLAVVGLVVFARRHRARPPRSRISRLIAGNALVLVVLASTVFAGFEAYYRFVFDATDSMGLGLVSTRWFERHFQNNNIPVRDDVDYELRLRPGARRVTFLGDSFTAGHGVADVSDRFVNLLRASRPNWEVHGIAKNGTGTVTHGVFLQELIAGGYELDLVVLVYVLNDILDVAPEREEIVRRVYAGEDDQGWWIRNSYFLDTLHSRHRARTDPALTDLRDLIRRSYDGPTWTAQAAALGRIRRIVTDAGGRLLVVTFPFLPGVGPDCTHGTAHEQLGRLWRSLGVPHLDLLDVYSSANPADLVVNEHDAHPNELAHRMAASAIEEFLDGHLGR